jgi:DnaJ family protein C protein 28
VRHRTELGHFPLDNDDSANWNAVLLQHEDMVKKLNAKIDKYNLLVPLLEKQKLHILLKREAENILKSGKTRYDVRDQTHASSTKAGAKQRTDFLDIFGSFYPW